MFVKVFSKDNIWCRLATQFYKKNSPLGDGVQSSSSVSSLPRQVLPQADQKENHVLLPSLKYSNQQVYQINL